MRRGREHERWIGKLTARELLRRLPDYLIADAARELPKAERRRLHAELSEDQEVVPAERPTPSEPPTEVYAVMDSAGLVALYLEDTAAIAEARSRYFRTGHKPHRVSAWSPETHDDRYTSGRIVWWIDAEHETGAIPA